MILRRTFRTPIYSSIILFVSDLSKICSDAAWRLFWTRLAGPPFNEFEKNEWYGGRRVWNSPRKARLLSDGVGPWARPVYPSGRCPSRTAKAEKLRQSNWWSLGTNERKHTRREGKRKTQGFNLCCLLNMSLGYSVTHRPGLSASVALCGSEGGAPSDLASLLGK